VKGRPQAIQIFVGKSDFLTIFGTSKHSLMHFSEESNPLSIIELFQKRYTGAGETGRLLLTKPNSNLAARPREDLDDRRKDLKTRGRRSLHCDGPIARPV
jgi:hypothetical protein